MLAVTALLLNISGPKTGVPLTFKLLEGKLLWVRGENGSGKSTLLKTIIGLLSPLSGSVTWLQGRPNLFYLGHELALQRQLNVLEYCRIHPALGQTPSQGAIKQVLGRVGLLPQAFTLCGQLSRGQQQRLLLACAHLSQAKLWLLDEPFTALDADSRQIMLNSLIEHKTQGGAAIVVSHQPIPDICDEVLDVMG